jgi:alkylated DNA nucleotide flippase Atl1
LDTEIMMSPRDSKTALRGPHEFDADNASARKTRIVERVRAIPKGSVRTYGDIDPSAPRLVGHILATNHNLPWHRVIRADGSLPRGADQRDLLLREGVPMRGKRVDLHVARVPRDA